MKHIACTSNDAEGHRRQRLWKHPRLKDWSLEASHNPGWSLSESKGDRTKLVSGSLSENTEETNGGGGVTRAFGKSVGKVTL